MRKYIILLLTLFCFFNLNAENPFNGKSNPNYKNLKVYAKVLEHYEKSDFYLAQIDIVNTGDSTVSFWETTSNYGWMFDFNAAGVFFVNKNLRLSIEKKINDSQPESVVNNKIEIIPHSKYIIKAQFYIFNRDRFLKSNKNLRLVFHFFDSNFEPMEDDMLPSIISENTIDYTWQ